MYNNLFDRLSKYILIHVQYFGIIDSTIDIDICTIILFDRLSKYILLHVQYFGIIDSPIDIDTCTIFLFNRFSHIYWCMYNYSVN